MTRVLIVIGDARPAVEEIAEADTVVQLNDECSAARLIKDRDGLEEWQVKVVTA